MRKQLLNQQTYARKLKWLFVLFVFLLMPRGTWADYYDIAIQYGTEESNFHSVLVTENPADILGDGTMSYDQENNVLTLNGVNLTCSYESNAFISHNGYMDSEQVVTVRLVGSNTVTLGNNSYFFEGKRITFTAADNSASLNIVTQEGREIGIFSDRATPTFNDNLAYYSSTSEIKYSESYSLWIGGVQVTDANASNVLFLNENQEPAVVFDASTNTLTLNELAAGTRGVPYIMNGLENLTINLVGYSQIDECSCFIAKSGDGDENNNVTFTTSTTNPGELCVWYDDPDNPYDPENSFTPSPWYTGHTVSWENGLGWKEQLDSDYGYGFYITTDNSLSVGGFILRDNSGNIFNDGPFNETVSFDGNTLTLNNATIDGNIVVTDVLSALNIKVKGQNVINAGNQSAIKSLTSDVALSFAKEGTGDCSLQLNSDNVTVISTGFSEPTYTDLALVVEDENIDPEYANYADRGLYYYEYPDYYPVTSATITSYTTYDIIVNGETVTSVNKNSILKGSAGVGHISFDGDHTLTLNKVPNYVYDGSYPFIQTSMDLTINLVGINEFDCGQRIFITRMEGDEDTHTVTFTTDENHAGSLILTVGDQFDGFEAVYQNGLAFKPDGYYDPSDENKPALWIAQASLGLKVGGIVVTQGNSSDILGQGYPSASYDATSSTLTLTSCQYSHYTANFIDISSGITSLNIHLLGYNGIGYGSYGEEAHWLGAASACTVNITTDANVPGELEYWSGSLTDSNITLNSTDSGLTLNDNSLVPAGGTDNITYYGTGQFHDGTDGGTDDEDYPYYDYSGGMWYYSNAVRTDGNSNLPPTVMGIETGNGYVSRMRTNGSSGFVNLSFQYAWVNNENTSVSVALTSRDGATTYATGNMAASSSVVTLTPSADITMDDVCLTFISESPFAFLPVAVQMVTPQTYPITIAGKTITSKNASDVLGDGKVSYDTETNTLTLNGATIGGGSDLEPMEACGIEYTGAADLTISLKGTNTITGTGGCEAIRCDAFELETVPKLIFTRGDNNACSLQLKADDNTTVILGFSDVQGAWGLGTVDNGLAVIADNQVKYSQEDGLQIETVVNSQVNYVALSSVLLVSYYGLAISGVPVYEGNKDNITGDGISGTGSASFDPTSNTLTLNNIKLNPDYGQNEDVNVSIVTSLVQLNINLIGESQAYAIKAANENCAVTFKSAEENRGAASLNFWYSVDPYFIGFGENKVTYDDGLCLRDNATSGSFPKIVALYVPQVITDEPEYALYFPDHEFKFELEEEVEGFDIYYCNMLGGDPVKTTDGTFTLTPGDYALRCYPIYPGMNTDASWNYQFASEIYPKVIEKPSFSVAPGTYNDNLTVYIQNVPEQESTYINELDQSVMMPQVWYYIGDNQEDSVLYDPEVGIPVTESERISVYIIDGDSGKVVKSDTVMAEYTIPEYPIAVTFGDRQWATYVAAQDLALPTHLEAYIVTEVNRNEVTAESIDYLPEGVGVLLHRTDETSEFVARAYTGDLVDFTENLLVATETATSVSDLTADGSFIYVLFNDNFVRATTGNIPAGRCYLPVNVNAESRLAIRFGEDVTGIANVNRETINNNNNYYNLSGQRIVQPTKGLYIVNGKKVIIK